MPFRTNGKSCLTDAQHVRNAVARFGQVIDVSDADRDLAFANIEAAARYYKRRSFGDVVARSWRSSQA